MAYLAFSHMSSTLYLYVGFAAVAALGTGGLFLLQRHRVLSITPAPSKASYTSSSVSLIRSTCTSFRDTLALLRHPLVLLLAPIQFFSGLELSFWAGEFTLMLSPDVIGLVLCFTGLAEVLGGFVFGKLSDSCGRTVSLGLGGALYLTGLGLAGWLRSTSSAVAGSSTLQPQWAGAPAVAYVAAFCFGAGDSAFNTNIYAIIAALFRHPKNAPRSGGAIVPDNFDGSADSSASLLPAPNDGNPNKSVEEHSESVRAFTLFQLVQNIGSATGFWYALALPLHGASGTFSQLYVQAALLVVGVALFGIAEFVGLRARSNAQRTVGQLQETQIETG